MKIINHITSKDGITTKFSQITHDGKIIETTYVDYHNKHIICYSTQIGCKQGCIFCYSGIQNRFIRDLDSQEIIDQIYNVISYMNLSSNKPILLSAMGVGEPLDNYLSYITSMKMLSVNFHRFALSTNGSNPLLIKELANDTIDYNVKLSISLHSAFPIKRRSIIPLSESTPSIVNAAKIFDSMENHSVEFNVTLMDSINDSDMDAEMLCMMLVEYNVPDSILIKINKYNEVSNCTIKPSQNVDRFCGILKKHGVNFESYETNGADINAACGQMACINGGR